MHLTPSEELILNGEQGYVLQKTMEMLAALGDIYDARIAEISTAPIAMILKRGIVPVLHGDVVMDRGMRHRLSLATSLSHTLWRSLRQHASDSEQRSMA